jgi:hypothetical protein
VDERTQAESFPAALIHSLATIGEVTVHGYDADAVSPPPVATTVKMWAPTATLEYAAEPEQATGAAPSRAHVTLDALDAENANVADGDAVELAGPEVITTDGGGVTVQLSEADAVRPTPAATTVNVCAPVARFEYAIDPEQAIGAAPSSAHVVLDAFVAKNANDVEVDAVTLGGPDVIATVGGATGDDGAAGVIVHVAMACEDPYGFPTRTARTCLPTASAVSVNGDAQL